MTYWQATFTSAVGQVAVFGLEAPDEASAFRRALLRAPFRPDRYSLTEIPPLCAKHEVRHACPPATDPWNG